MSVFDHSIDYLKEGSERQQRAFHTLSRLSIFYILKNFNPTLAGTIPLDIDIVSSDLDIICESKDLKEFENILEEHFGKFNHFNCYWSLVRGVPSLIASFLADDFKIEIFCQNVPVGKQLAVIHLKIEARLLALSGIHTKEQLRSLKRQGMKTEEAFAYYYQLQGDPYETLAKMADATDEQLMSIVHNSLLSRSL